MTKEKIIEILEIAKDRNGDVPFEIAVKAISKMEIEALQQTDRDTISRQATLNIVDKIDIFQSGWRTYAMDQIKALPSAQPDLCDGCDRYGASCVGEGCGKLEMPEVAKDTNVPINDCISRQAAINAIENTDCELPPYAWDELTDAIMSVPSAQPEPISDAYMKAVWTWLLNYQIKAAELKGRYTPYEVLSWVANDWRKEHECK